MVAISWVPTMAEINEILPFPEAGRPIAVLSFVHVTTEPAGKAVNGTFTDTPLHTDTFCGWLTVGLGRTVMVKVSVAPIQELFDGFTVIVPVWTEPTVAAVKLMLPFPKDANPMLMLVLV